MLKRIYRVNNAARVMASARAETARSAWERGCWREACDMLEIVPDGEYDDPKSLLNGADSIWQYANGANLVYNRDIAERFMTPSELKRWHAPGHDGGMAFNGESILDMYERACARAYQLARSVTLRRVHVKEATNA